MKDEKWLIRGGWSAHGELTVSGDSFSAIANISAALLSSDPKSITNVPRSNITLSFITFLNNCGFNIEWRGISRIKCNVDWSRFNPDLSKVEFDDFRHMEIVADIVLAKLNRCLLPLKFRKYLTRYRRLKFEIHLIEGVGYQITVPEIPEIKKMHIKSDQRDFYTVLSYSLLKFVYPEIYIAYKGVFDPANVFSDAEKLEKSTYKVNMNAIEFNFYTSLAMLTEGELKLQNVALSESLGYLLLLFEVGASYEVEGGTLKIWQDYKKIEQYYNFVKTAPDELGYLLLYLSVFATNKILVKAKNIPQNLKIIKNLNIMGCQLSYSDFESESIMVEVKPSNLKSFKQQVTSLESGGIILAASFIYDGNTIVSEINQFSEYLPFLSDNLTEIGLKFSTR